MPSFNSIASPDLVVLTPASPDNQFQEAICGRSFIKNLPTGNENNFPDALFQAKTPKAVEQAVQFCCENDLKVCVRSGGHNWESIWLQGKGSVLLDVGDLNQIGQVNMAEKTIQVGPGSKGSEVLKSLPDDLFLPCGHCDGVPLGGFLLGGGLGLGYPRYGVTSMFVKEVDVVLADGKSVTASGEGARNGDAKQKAIMDLVMGSYTSFPGVITKYSLGPLPARPKGVMSGAIIFDIKDWTKAFDALRNIEASDEPTAETIECACVMTYAPPPVAEATGVEIVTILAMTIFADTPEEGLQIWKTNTKDIKGSLLPVEDPKHLPVEDLPSTYAPFYPKGARYLTQGFKAVGSLQKIAKDSLEASIQPIADMWASGENRPPPPSHTLMAGTHKSLQNKGPMVTGFATSLSVLSYAIHQDPAMDNTYREVLDKAHDKLGVHPSFKTCLVEGNSRVRGISSGFSEEGLAKVKQLVQELDPKGVFGGFAK